MAVRLHRIAEKITEILIYFIIIFSSWAFGSTELWSSWIINASAFALGIILVTKWVIRSKINFNVCKNLNQKELSIKQRRLSFVKNTCNILIAFSIGLLLAYILTSAINARASFSINTKEYTYFNTFNPSIPHTYDARATWLIFWQYLGLMLLFYSARDWIVGAKYFEQTISINPRLKRLLYVVLINGGILALESIIQNLYYGEYQEGKLLFLVEPGINSLSEGQFGPFAYRSNACSYQNLLWPIGIGLFIQLGRENHEYKNKRIGLSSELILLPCIILSASSSVISSSRGGSLVMLGLMIVCMCYVYTLKNRSNFIKFSIPISMLLLLIIGFQFGWDKLEARLLNIFTDNLGGRSGIYNTTLKAINDYGIYGTGPGTFESIMQFEIGESLGKWESWAHNDYLEFYLTLGKPGVIILVFIIFLFLSSCYIQYLNRSSNKIIMPFCLIAIFGLGTHAIMDFPLQVHSILVILTIICSIINNNKKHQYDKKT